MVVAESAKNSMDCDYDMHVFICHIGYMINVLTHCTVESSIHQYKHKYDVEHFPITAKLPDCKLKDNN